MKAFNLTILLFCIWISSLLGQSQRKVLIEHFTQASCGPCAAINPQLQPILERNKTKITKITHQVSWPGVDPMNKDNPGEVQDRVNYYGVTGVPDIFLDAYSSGNPTQTITDASIQNEYLKPSPYEISINNTVLPDYNSIEVEVTVKLTGATTTKPVLRIAVLEKIISWTSPPGSNGEKNFYHVMKKYLPSSKGISISDINQPGQTKTFKYVYKFDKLYNFKNLETAAFIQDDATKEIHQSENKEVLFTPTAGLDVAIKQANPTGNFIDTVICGNQTAPIVKIINTGNQSVTALDFIYSVNGGAQSTYQWTGKLDFLKEVDIVLPAINFTAYKGQNTMNISVNKVNGGDDINVINNASSLNFQSAPSTTILSTFEMKPGAQPALLSFTIKDDQGKLILSDGPFTDNTAKTYFFNLEKDRCYTVQTINSTSSLNGTYKIFDEQINLIIQQRVLGVGTAERDFGTYTVTVANQDVSNAKNLKLFPNPVNDFSTLEFTSNHSGTAQLLILDVNGNQISDKSIQLNSGLNQIPLNLKNLNSGVYFIQLNQNNQLVGTSRLIRF